MPLWRNWSARALVQKMCFARAQLAAGRQYRKKKRTTDNLGGEAKITRDLLFVFSLSF